MFCYNIWYDENMEIVEMLRRILADAGWSQERLAQELGVPFVTVNRWINEKARPRQGNIEAIRRLYLSISGGEALDEGALRELEREALTCRLGVGELIENDELLRRFTLYSTYHTDAIEGSTMTLADVEKILDDRDKVLANKTAREQLEARNHRSALYFLLDELHDKGEDFVWTVDLILNIHLRLMNSIISNAGQLRRHGVMILGSKAVLAEVDEISDKLEELVWRLNVWAGDSSDWHRGDLFDWMAQTHASFEQIHPFSDGNGRVGRLILDVQALKEGLLPPLVMKERKKAYYKFLERAQREGDYRPLREFLIESIVTTKDVLEL